MCQYIFVKYYCGHAYDTHRWDCLNALEGKACIPGQLSSSTRTVEEKCVFCGGKAVVREKAKVDAWRFF